MTYLELLKNFAIDYGISGAHRTITTFNSLPGEMLQAKRQIDRAYEVICNKWLDWTFLNNEVEYLVPANADRIGPETDGWRTNIRSFREHALYIRDDQRRDRITQVDWNYFRDRRGTEFYGPTDQLQLEFAVDPAGNIHFYRPCNTQTVLNCEVSIMHTDMVAETDEPLWPHQYHNVILYRAAMYHFSEQESPQQLFDAKEDFKEAMMQLEIAFRPGGSRHGTAEDDCNLVMVTE